MILGIYNPAQGVGHDTGIALIQEDGQILACHSEERFSRVKMDGGFPFRALESLRRLVPFRTEDLSCVAVPFMGTVDKTKEGSHFLVASLKDPSICFKQAQNRVGQDRFQKGMTAIGAYDYLPDYISRLKEVREKDQRPELNDWKEFLHYAGFDTVPLIQMDHHVAHAAGAYFTSGWDQALLITCDGLGALKSGIVAVGDKGRIRVLARTFYPHSPGGFWEAVTVICGFHHMKHGGKITGLAALGDPDAGAYEVMKESLQMNGLTVRSYVDPARMAQRLRNYSREDIAATAQRRLEEVVTHLIRNAVEKTGITRVALAGGVFGNVKLNQKIAELDRIDEVYIYPAMGDEGLGLGAALYAAAKGFSVRPFRLSDLYLGPDFTDQEIENVLRSNQIQFRKYSDQDLADRIASLLHDGRVVAIFRGRMEFGPRALGHRSILCRAIDPTVNDWLNKRLLRTEFMPFAPVTLEEHAERCYKDLPSRSYAAQFMTITCDCTDWMKQVSPAVVHKDGTARPQLLNQKTEPFYYQILECYYRKSGIPSLINTSFNMHEEPIVCTPQDAVRAFLQGKLDALAIGPYLCLLEQESSRS